ncbi:MAG: polyprenyl synthetase family protein, partial [Kineothrix sp.]|nr:polyprenyl synthetase family protein [Kineothrix sp.]
MMIGAILAGASKEEIAKIEKCAYNIGIAFQIQDDILDVTGSLKTLGKQTGSDEKNKKITYVTLKGIEQAMKDMENLSVDAIEILSSFKDRNEFLEDLVRRLITREK